jgi:hypothetical protein
MLEVTLYTRVLNSICNLAHGCSVLCDLKCQSELPLGCHVTVSNMPVVFHIVHSHFNTNVALVCSQSVFAVTT